MVSITFTQPDILIFLAGIPVLIFAHLASQKYAKTRALMFANFEAVKRVMGNKRDITNIPRLSGNWILLAFRLTAYTVLVLAIAGTTLWTEAQVTEQDFILAVDASGSMLAQDILPSRFQAAKDSGAYFITLLNGVGNIGVISFSGNPMLLAPLSPNHQESLEAISRMEISRVSGTDISSTIMLASNYLSVSERSRSIVLITDGRQTVATLMNPSLIYAREKNVVIHVIGIGTEEGGSFTEDGLITSIDTESLAMIADETGGSMTIVRDEDALRRALFEIADLKQGLKQTNLAYYFMLAAFIMLFLEWGLLNSVFRNLP
jgi:Ca-activated chloride channel homolog